MTHKHAFNTINTERIHDRVFDVILEESLHEILDRS